VHVPAVLLTLVHAAALAVALTDVGTHALAGVVVLAGLTTRWVLRSRRPAPAAVAPAAAESPAT
jgi:cytochrome b561